MEHITLTDDEQNILLIVSEQISELREKSAEDKLSLDDCKKLAILHDTLNKIIHPVGDIDDENPALNISPEDLIKYLDKLNSDEPTIKLVKDDDASGT